MNSADVTAPEHSGASEASMAPPSAGGDGDAGRFAKSTVPVVAVLFLAYLMCYADRAAPTLLMEPIKASFGLTDTQIALLTGFSFSISISIFALPLSWIADRYNRALLITLGIVLWCATTIGCGFATGFWSLFLLRMGVGLGEAALGPAAISLIADLIPAHKLPRPMAIIALSTMLGGVLALNGGGLLYGLFKTPSVAHVLGYSPADAWRATMIVFGAVGMLVAVATHLVLPEPRRLLSKGHRKADAARSVSLVDYLRKSAFFYAPFTLSMCAFCLYSAGWGTWLAPFFSRTYGWSVVQIGQVLGLMTLVCSLAGLPLGPFLTDVISKRLGRQAPVAMIWMCLAPTIPITFLIPFAPNPWLAVAGMAFVSVLGSATTVICPVVFTSTTPTQVRARVVSISYLCFGVLGTSTGGVVYALFTDKVLRDPLKLPITLSLVSGVLLIISVALLVVVDRRHERAKRLAETAAFSPSASGEVAPAPAV